MNKKIPFPIALIIIIFFALLSFYICYSDIQRTNERYNIVNYNLLVFYN